MIFYTPLPVDKVHTPLPPRSNPGSANALVCKQFLYLTSKISLAVYGLTNLIRTVGCQQGQRCGVEVGRVQENLSIEH